MDFYDDEIFCANSLTILEGKKKSLTMGGTTFWFFFFFWVWGGGGGGRGLLLALIK